MTKYNLGYASTAEDKSGERKLSNKDGFAYSYNITYKTTINSNGSIGDINFYTDHHILDDVMAVYVNVEEFVMDYEPLIVKSKGIDSYIGHILKRVDTEYSLRESSKNVAMNDEKVPVGNYLNVINNPGGASYEDMKAYMTWKSEQRLKT
jgi:hypothetical protein